MRECADSEELGRIGAPRPWLLSIPGIRRVRGRSSFMRRCPWLPVTRPRGCTRRSFAAGSVRTLPSRRAASPPPPPSRTTPAFERSTGTATWPGYWKPWTSPHEPASATTTSGTHPAQWSCADKSWGIPVIRNSRLTLRIYQRAPWSKLRHSFASPHASSQDTQEQHGDHGLVDRSLPEQSVRLS